jgi:LPXTG-motif cell wall-anchored protein
MMVCNLLTNTCGGGSTLDAGVDAGKDAGLDSGMMVADAGEDAAPPDAAADTGGPDARADSAGPPPVDGGEDSGSPAADASDAGYVEGGGCSCKTAGTGDDGETGGAMGAALGGLGLLLTRRRRKSAWGRRALVLSPAERVRVW